MVGRKAGERAFGGESQCVFSYVCLSASRGSGFKSLCLAYWMNYSCTNGTSRDTVNFSLAMVGISTTGASYYWSCGVISLCFSGLTFSGLFLMYACLGKPYAYSLWLIIFSYTFSVPFFLSFIGLCVYNSLWCTLHALCISVLCYYVYLFDVLCLMFIYFPEPGIYLNCHAQESHG